MVTVYDVSVVCDSCSETVEVVAPPSRRKYALWGMFLLGALGLGIGLSIGVATAGFGITAMPFTTVIGMFLGYRGGVWIAKRRQGINCPECGHNFIRSTREKAKSFA